MIHCCIDLELEQPKSNPQTPDSLLSEEKIIQVGYVIYRLDPEFEVLKEVCKHINIGVPISSFIKTLTNIKDSDIQNGDSIQSVYNELCSDQEFYKFSRVIKQWGSGDIECFKKEVGNPNDWKFGRSGLNIKHLYQVYAEANEMGASGGLSKSMGKCGLIWKRGRKHNALNDAYNTARFHHFLYSKLKV